MTAAKKAAAPKVEEEAGPQDVPIHVALCRVMRDVQVIAKDQQTAATGRYMYRGVDQVVNEVGPALRAHGVLCIPRALSIQHRDATTTGGKTVHEVIVEIEFTFYGPLGDCIVGSAFGESTDASDKATAQASSVALRTFLLQGLVIPSGDVDPDEREVSRGGGQTAKATPTPSAPSPTQLGWDDATERKRAWDSLTERVIDLGKEADDLVKPIIAWAREQKLDLPTFTKEQAVTQRAMLTEAEEALKLRLDAAEGQLAEQFDPDTKFTPEELAETPGQLDNEEPF